MFFLSFLFGILEFLLVRQKMFLLKFHLFQLIFFLAGKVFGGKCFRPKKKRGGLKKSGQQSIWTWNWGRSGRRIEVDQDVNLVVKSSISFFWNDVRALPRQLLCLAPAAAVPCPHALPPIFSRPNFSVVRSSFVRPSIVRRPSVRTTIWLRTKKTSLRELRRRN